MPTNTRLASVVSIDPSASSTKPTSAEIAAWNAMFAGPSSVGRALWFDASQTGLSKNNGASDEPSGFYAMDRSGFQPWVAGRTFIPHPARNKHPIKVTDSITSKPAWVFGAGGAGPNALDFVNNGALILASQYVNGVEVGNTPILLPTNGYSIAVKFRVPVPGTTVDGISFPSSGTYTGGTILGGSSAAGDAFSLEVSPSNGFLVLNNRIDKTQFRTNVDLRDGAWHTAILIWEPSNSSFACYLDGTSQANFTTPLNFDIAASTGTDKAMIGAYGNPLTDPTNRFIGILAFLAFLPSSTLANSGNRTLMMTLMAEK